MVAPAALRSRSVRLTWSLLCSRLLKSQLVSAYHHDVDYRASNRFPTIFENLHSIFAVDTKKTSMPLNPESSPNVICSCQTSDTVLVSAARPYTSSDCTAVVQGHFFRTLRPILRSIFLQPPHDGRCRGFDTAGERHNYHISFCMDK